MKLLLVFHIFLFFFSKLREFHWKYEAVCGLSLRKIILTDLWSWRILTFTVLLELFQVRNWMLTTTDLHEIINSKVHADHHHHHHHSGTKSKIILGTPVVIPVVLSWCCQHSGENITSSLLQCRDWESTLDYTGIVYNTATPAEQSGSSREEGGFNIEIEIKLF